MDDTRRPAQRLQSARAALLSKPSVRLLEQVRNAFCESTRSQILRALSTGSLTVNELAAVIGRTKWATSQHLRVLRNESLVVGERRGRTVRYRLTEGPASQSALDALAAVEKAAVAV